MNPARMPSAGIFIPPRPPNAERRFAPSMVTDVVKNFTLTLWNIYSFFVTYANLDGWKPAALPILPTGQEDKGAGALDRWLLSSMNTLVRDVTKAYEAYDVPGATRPIESFVESLSTWYLRRSRRRFWKSESDTDKQSAYSTLYTALVTLSKLLAPAMPFLAEEMYGNLVCSIDPNAPESVHLASWPKADEAHDRRDAEPGNGPGDENGFAGPQRPSESQPESAPAAGRSGLRPQPPGRIPRRGNLRRPDHRRTEREESAPAGYHAGSSLVLGQAAAQTTGAEIRK